VYESADIAEVDQIGMRSPQYDTISLRGDELETGSGRQRGLLKHGLQLGTRMVTISSDIRQFFPSLHYTRPDERIDRLKL
jgi:hypothetical protein